MRSRRLFDVRKSAHGICISYENWAEPTRPEMRRPPAVPGGLACRARIASVRVACSWRSGIQGRQTCIAEDLSALARRDERVIERFAVRGEVRGPREAERGAKRVDREDVVVNCRRHASGRARPVVLLAQVEVVLDLRTEAT